MRSMDVWRRGASMKGLTLGSLSGAGQRGRGPEIGQGVDVQVVLFGEYILGIFAQGALRLKDGR